MVWFQETLELAPRTRGFHLITGEVAACLPELEKIRVGLLHVFIHHTSASLTISENASRNVRGDFERHLSELVPENAHYQHASEGPDDMPAHIKASLLGSSLTLPVKDGRLLLGTWQGIFLCEHRNSGGPRTLTVTVQGTVQAG